MELSATTTDHLQIIRVAEDRIDAAVAIAFKDNMRSLTEGGEGDVLLDLSQVEFIDSSGLGAIVAAMKQLGADRKLQLASMSANVDKVFRLTRMDMVFTIHGSVEDAIDGCAS